MKNTDCPKVSPYKTPLPVSDPEKTNSNSVLIFLQQTITTSMTFHLRKDVPLSTVSSDFYQGISYSSDEDLPSSVLAAGLATSSSADAAINVYTSSSNVACSSSKTRTHEVVTTGLAREPRSSESDYDDISITSWYKSKEKTTKTVLPKSPQHDISCSEDDDGYVPLSERLGLGTSKPSKPVHHSLHDLSDSSEDGVGFPAARPGSSVGLGGVTLDRAQASHKSMDRDRHVSGSCDVVGLLPCDPGGSRLCDDRGVAESLHSKKRKALPKSSEDKEHQIMEKKNKEDEKMKKKLEAEEKRKLKEYEKAKQRTLKEAQKASRPAEAKKQLTVMLDPGVMRLPGTATLLQLYQQHEVTYEVSPQPLPDLITFWREVTEVRETVPLQLETVKREVVEDEILLIMSVADFVQCVHVFKQRQMGAFLNMERATLREHILKYRDTLENRKITLIVQGIEKYFRDLRTVGQRQFRNQVAALGDEPEQRPRGRKKKTAALDDVHGLITVSRLDIEEALVDIQIHTESTARFVEKDADLARTIFQYTKSVAEAPFKRERCQPGLALYIDGAGSVAVSKDGAGVQQLWRKQLQAFKSVTAEVANAIMAAYKMPLDLYEAYNNCMTEKDAELLLQDIVIRRGVGVMATSRRVGKEMSRRLYQLFMSENPDLVLV